ncbi:tRNA (guanine-N(7)-)-methyltransferase, partial [Linum perenne]
SGDGAATTPVPMAAAKLALLSPSLSSFSKYSANFRRYSVKVNACFDATKQLTSPNLVTLEYADLNLPSAVRLFNFVLPLFSLLCQFPSTSYEILKVPIFIQLQNVGHVRLRQHVNPLSSSFSVSNLDLFLAPPFTGRVEKRENVWCRCQHQCPIGKKFLGIQLCLSWWILEAGVEDSSCGWRRGIQIQEITWAWKLGKKYGGTSPNLGCGILHFLVKRAESWVKDLALSNAHFIFANAAVSFSHLIASYPGPLTLVSILCPDPHFKKRHHKRRVVQKPLVASILDNLVPGGKVFVQSDVLEVALAMRNQFDAESDMLQHVDEIDSSLQCDENGWLVNNPMGIRTEREIHAESEGATIYRRLYQKRTKLNK